MSVIDDVPLQRPRPLRTMLSTLSSAPPYPFLAVISGLMLLLLYTVLFQLTTTFEVFFLSSTPIYIAASIILTLLIAALGGLTITQSAYLLSARAARRGSGAFSGLAGTGIGALASGCPSCASILLPALGIAGSLAAFPLGGLEIKLLSLIVLGSVVWENSRTIAGVCPVDQPKLARMDDDGAVVLNLSGVTLRSFRTVGLIVLAVVAVYVLPRLPSDYRVSFASQNAPEILQVVGPPGSPNSGQNANPNPSASTAALLEEINPTEGYALPYTYGDIGPQLLEAGAFDLAQFSELYASRGAPLSDEQIQMLGEGSDEPIVINKQNAHMLLNFFWALGLTNKNSILEEGPLMENAQGDVTGYASTGGWSLATKPVPELYSSVEIITLTEDQQALVEEAASNTYRPCCNNSTLFADCNHGMAMLGLFELMASQGASLDEMFEAAKYFNAYWFPQQTYDLAMYFQSTTGESFADIDSRTLVGSQFSSGSGWRSIRQWLMQNGKIEQVPGGGGCGV